MKLESYGSPSQSIQWDIPFLVSIGTWRGGLLRLLGIWHFGEVEEQLDREEEEDGGLVEEEDMDDEEWE